MVYYKKFKRNRRKLKTTTDVAYKALKTANYVKRQYKPEVKINDALDLVGEDVDNNGVIIPLTSGANAIDQGDNSGQRIGIKVRPLRIECRMWSTIDPPLNHAQVRCVIFSYKQQNDATGPSVLEYLEINDPLSPKDWVNKTHFTTHYDRVWNMDVSERSSLAIKKSIKLSKPLVYGSASAPEANHLYMLLITDQATNFPNVQYYCRLYFTDV